MDAGKTGEYLAMLRRARGMTQQEAAEQLNLSNKTISKWESGGGFPDITVLPALAELYGVTTDDILAGETLRGTKREQAAAGRSAAEKRLLGRLRMRFDVCFVLSLALAVLGMLQIPYVSLTALPLSVASVWMGYILTSHPLRYGGVTEERKLYENLYRKLLAASGLQWLALLGMIHLGTVDWSRTDLENLTVPYTGDHWKPVIFLAGLVLLWGLLEAGVRRRAGKDARLLPGNWKAWALWGIWLTVFLAVWTAVDYRFDVALAPWVERYGADVLHDSRFDEWWPTLREERDNALMPFLWARRITAGAGGVITVVLLAVTLRRIWRKKPGQPLAPKEE